MPQVSQLHSRGWYRVQPQDYPLRLLSIGRTAPAAVREALFFGSSEAAEALARLRDGTPAPGDHRWQNPLLPRRLVILSTCHRVELYADIDGNAEEARGRLIDWLASARPVSRELIAAASTYREGSAALRHLHHVTAGLDAALLGEAEIIAQVRAALQVSIAAHAASPALKAAFRSAVASAENARRSVWQRFPRVDIGSVAVGAIVEHLGGLEGRASLVIGTGRVGTLAARALYHAGARLTIVNRTGDRARALAARFKAQWEPFECLAEAAARADAIVVATGAPHLVLHAPMLAGTAGCDRDVVVADTAMPRNADPAIASMPHARLVELGELHARTATALAGRAAAVPEVETLTQEAVASLLARPRTGRARRPITIGTRGTPLARRQAEQVAAMLVAVHPETDVRWRVYAGSGDDRLDIPFAELADDAFTDRIERALLGGEIDAAVHSYKDLPARPVTGLVIAAIPARADPREALVARDGATLAALRPGAVIGTSSPRRAAALKALRPDCELRSIRGPVDARLEQVLGGEYDAAIFALAGLQRLGLAHHVSEIFDRAVIAPAAGQGALAVQCREHDIACRRLLSRIDDPRLRAQVEAEREPAPLRGRRILVTRPEAQAQSLCDALMALGAVPVRLPLLRVEPLDPGPDAWRGIATSHWIVFTSANGVEQAWNVAPLETRAALRAHPGIAVIGPATARAAARCGMRVRCISSVHVAESLAAALGDTAGRRVLWLRGERARDALPSRLRAAGAEVTEVVVYRAVAAHLAGDVRGIVDGVDLVTLTSPLAVERFREVAGANFTGPVACIGPVTAASARAHGMHVAAVAETYTADGLVAALRRAAPFEVPVNA